MTPPAVTKEVFVPAATDSGAAKKQKVGVGRGRRGKGGR